MKLNIKNKFGFTLIEMVVAMAIFLIVISVYMSIFVSTTRMHAKIIAIQKVQNEIRYVTELLASGIRMGTINYDYYGENLDNPKTTLALIDNSGSKVYYKVENEVFKMSYNNGTWIDISYDNIQFNRMSFYITDKQKHPGVMFFIDANYKKSAIDKQKDARFILQSFASSRQYK